MIEVALSRPVNLLAIHHSASPLSTTVAEIEVWHRKKGWNGIGYHHIVTADGLLHAGRPLDVAGAHVEGHNAHSVGLCLVGDNTKPEAQWTAAQRRVLAEYVYWFRVFHPNAEIAGHGEVPGAATLCPGLKVRDLLSALGL